MRKRLLARSKCVFRTDQRQGLAFPFKGYRQSVLTGAYTHGL